MTNTNQKQDRFGQLHRRFVPRLYRAALYLLGDSEAAEEVASRVWIEAFSDPSCRIDSRVFGLCADRLLIDYCKRKKHLEYHIPVQGGDALLESLAALDFDSRCLIVLAAVQNRSAHEIALILNRSEWTILRELEQVTQSLCRANLEVCC